MTQETSSAPTGGDAVDSILDEANSSSLARRGFIKGGLGVAGFAAASSVLAACGDDADEAPAPTATDAPDAPDAAETTTTAAAAEPTDTVAVTAQGPELEWQMATSWPTALVTLFGSAQYFARRVGELTGGRFVIRGGEKHVLEGPAVPERIVLLQFPDVAAAKRMYNSAEYQAAIKVRAGAAEASFIVMEGFA